MDKSTPEVITEIRRVAQETGLKGQWKRLCEELDKRGVHSARGRQWKPNALMNFCLRHAIFDDVTLEKTDDTESPQTTPAPQNTTQTEPHEQVEIPQDTTPAVQPETSEQEPIPQECAPVPQLDPETFAVLKQVAEWWKSKGAEIAMKNVTWEEESPEPAYRPNLPGKKQNTGIRINARLLEDALAKAQTPEELVKTGRGLSPLIERLLWQYLGFDEKYLHG